MLHNVYCPRCGAELGRKVEGGRERPACFAEGCGYFHFTNASIGCGGVVLRDGKALLIQRGHDPGRGLWQIPGGYVEDDEALPAAIEREVYEEAGIVARVRESLGFRHSASTEQRPIPNIYVVFRLDVVSGEPQADGDETLDAGFFSVEEIERKEGAQALSLWAVRLALAADAAGGGHVAQEGAGGPRPGWSLFGPAIPPAP